MVKTGAEGSAHAEPIEPGSWRISASADGHLPAALPVRQIAPGSEDRVALRLASGGRTLRGTVSDTSGGPVAGARIEVAKLTASASLDDAVSTTATTDDGTYRMTVAEGSHWIAVTSADYAPQSRRIQVGPAGAVANFALVPGGVIEGVVKDDHTQAPVAGANVRARRTPGVLFGAERRVIAGPEGRFRLTGLRPGDWQLDAAAPPRASHNATHVGLAVGEQVSDVELLIGANPTLRGRVVDELGAPAPGVEVHAVGRSTTTVVADAAGNFVFEGLRFEHLRPVRGVAGPPACRGHGRVARRPGRRRRRGPCQARPRDQGPRRAAPALPGPARVRARHRARHPRGARRGDRARR